MRWIWDDTRISAYIAHLTKIRQKRYTPATLPSEHYARLYQFLELYEEIDQIIRSCKGSWGNKIITDFFEQRSIRKKTGQSTNRLRMADWQELERIVKHYYIPF
jgi:hypothetical protein